MVLDPCNWVTNKIIQVSIILFSNALHCTPCVPSFPFFFYFRDFDSQFTCTNSCHLSVCYICLINQIIVIIVYKFIIWLFCSQECHWLTNIAFVCMSANFTFCLKVNIIKKNSLLQLFFFLRIWYFRIKISLLDTKWHR